MFCVVDIFSTQLDLFANNAFSQGFNVRHEASCNKFEKLFELGEETPSVVACVRLNDMFSELVRLYQTNIGVSSSETGSNSMTKLSSGWLRNFRDIIIGLSRFPIFTTYLRIPTEIWTMGWQVDDQNQSNLEDATVFPYNIPGKVFVSYFLRFYLL